MRIKNAALVSRSKLSREMREKFPAQNSAYKGIPGGWGQGPAMCRGGKQPLRKLLECLPPCMELLRQDGICVLSDNAGTLLPKR